MNNILTKALMENAIEITWMFDSLMRFGEIKPWDMLTEEYCGSDGIKEEFYEIAREFEKKYPYDTAWKNGNLDYLEEIEKFAREKLIEKFGSPELQESKKVIDWVNGALEHYGAEDIEVGIDGKHPEMITIYTDYSTYGECIAQYDKCDIDVLKQQLEDMGISEDL